MRTTMPSNIGLHHHDEHPTAHLAERTVALTAASLLGVALIFLGFGGMVYPAYLGMHLNLVHSVLLLATGIASMLIGMTGTVSSASMFCIVAGGFYLALALLGVAFGVPGEHTLPTVHHHGLDDQLLRLVPGYLEFASRDHVLHGVLGAAYLLSAFLGWLGIDDEHR